MASGFLVLMRFFLRVDGVLVRINDTRLYLQVREGLAGRTGGGLMYINETGTQCCANFKLLCFLELCQCLFPGGTLILGRFVVVVYPHCPTFPSFLCPAHRPGWF